MLGFKVEVYGLYFATFRKPTSTSIILSYSVPPYTTIRGLLANALGLKRDDYSIQDWIKIGIIPRNFSNKSEEMAKILKLKGTGEVHRRVFPSSPMFRQFLVSPSYDICLAGEDNNVNRLYNALLHPARPLYIGGSDDLVDIEPHKPAEVKEVVTNRVLGVIEGAHEKCIIENIPYKFIKKDKDYTIEYKMISVPQDRDLLLKASAKCWQFDDVYVWLA
jgi:CRISPR-associated protein Cas5h